MTYVYDEDVVLAKASHVRRTVETIRSLSSPDNLGVKEWIRDDVTVLNLQRAVEIVRGIARDRLGDLESLVASLLGRLRPVSTP